MLPELFVLVVTTITPVPGTTTFTSNTVTTPKLSSEKCAALSNATYKEAVEKKINVVVKCAPQD